MVRVPVPSMARAPPWVPPYTRTHFRVLVSSTTILNPLPISRAIRFRVEPLKFVRVRVLVSWS